jgi:hypothetical protein
VDASPIERRSAKTIKQSATRRWNHADGLLLHRGAPLSASKLAMLLVYGGTLFLSAILVFLVQLILGKMITPLMGGTPEVWNTCMVFFQAMLLAGYAYAHWSTTTLGPRKQAMIHLCLMVLPLIFLFPIGVTKGLIPDGSDPTAFNAGPIGTVLILLFVAVGIPFFVVSASAPMLQKWFSSTDHPSAADPYFLYGASNLGSMGLLILYPTVIEPTLGIRAQGWIWTVGYLCLFALTALCAFMMWNTAPAKPTPEPVSTDPTDENHPLSGKVTWGRRLRWIALALVPSSLLLGATSYMTTDIAPIPLLWVIPLAIYLFTFIIVFSKTPARIQDWLVGFLEPMFPAGSTKTLRSVIDGHKLLVLILPLLVLLMVFLMMAEGIRKPSIFWLIALHMSTLFVVAMVCHGELARDRPSTKYLTEFFMWMSFGGVVGGLLNSLFAPVMFDGYYEYPLAMVIACMLLPALSNEEESKWGLVLDSALAGLFVLVGTLLIVLRLFDEDLGFQRMELNKYRWFVFAVFGVGILGTWYLLKSKKDTLVRIMDLVLPVTLAFLTIGLIWGMGSDYLTKNVLEVTDKVTGQVIGYESRLDRVTSWVNVVIGYIGAPFQANWEISGQQFATIVSFGLPAILCYTFVERSLRFGLGVAAILMAGSFCAMLASNDLLQERGFFGVLKVEQSREYFRRDPRTREVVAYDKSHRLVHGTTLHGKQYYHFMQREEDGWQAYVSSERGDPLTYYHRTGPIGQVCAAYNTNPMGLGLAAGPLAGVYGWKATTSDNPDLPVNGKLGVIGLGTGTMATYARPGQTVVFYDIDPLVKRISFDERKFDEKGRLAQGEEREYFTYVKDARKRGANVELRLNDARLAIEREVDALKKKAAAEAGASSGSAFDKVYARLRNEEGYKILVVDAFSSDAIPIHLTTLDALKLYLEYMRDDGIVCFHISNRYLKLQPVLANLVEEIKKTDPNEANLTGLYENDQEYGIPGKASSSWVMIARDKKYLSKLMTRKQFEEERAPLQNALGAAASLGDLVGPAASVCLALDALITHEESYRRNGVPIKHSLLRGPWKPLTPIKVVGVWTDDYAPIWYAFDWGQDTDD